MGPLVKTIMTRCIHCTRCIRFATEIAPLPPGVHAATLVVLPARVERALGTVRVIERLELVCDRLLVLEDGVVARDLTGPFTADAVLEAVFATPTGGTR